MILIDRKRKGFYRVFLKHKSIQFEIFSNGYNQANAVVNP